MTTTVTTQTDTRFTTLDGSHSLPTGQPSVEAARALMKTLDPEGEKYRLEVRTSVITTESTDWLPEAHGDLHGTVLVDGSGGRFAWWLYNANTDRWYVLCDDDLEPGDLDGDVEETLSATTERTGSITGFDRGAHSVIDAFGVTA